VTEQNHDSNPPLPDQGDVRIGELLDHLVGNAAEQPAAHSGDASPAHDHRAVSAAVDFFISLGTSGLMRSSASSTVPKKSLRKKLAPNVIDIYLTRPIVSLEYNAAAKAIQAHTNKATKAD
jgi:hypothetical protein